MVSPKTFLITGCSSGLGRALVEAVLEAGHRVVATARDIRSIVDLEASGRCHILTLDVTEGTQITEAVSEARAVWGSVDVLINNAGCGLIGAVEECSDEETRANMETNFFGPLSLIQHVLPIMREQRSGTIINISAAAAISNYPGFGVYGGAKAALEFVSESLRAEVTALGIRVTLVQPGPFRTDFVARSVREAAARIPDYESTSGKFAQLIRTMDGKQPGDPAKAAQAILSAALSDKPPLRLVLGKYANAKARKRYADLEAERTANEAIGLHTEFA
jgi:NAD(P)-dependent dehydrogenase (short-subunit alcohol dehydrogenase family)